MPLKCVRCSIWHWMVVMVSKHLHIWRWYQSVCDDTFKELYQSKWIYISSNKIDSFPHVSVTIKSCRVVAFDFAIDRKSSTCRAKYNQTESHNVNKPQTEWNEIADLHFLLLLLLLIVLGGSRKYAWNISLHKWMQTSVSQTENRNNLLFLINKRYRLSHNRLVSRAVILLICV